MYIHKESENLSFNKQNLISLTEGVMTTKYEITKKLGKGAYGKVLEVNGVTRELPIINQ